MDVVSCSRRRFMQIGGAFATTACGSATALGAESDKGPLQRRVSRYLETLRRSDGGYGWEGQEDSHLTVTHAAVGTLRILDCQLPESKEIAAFIRNGHPTDGPRRQTRHHWAELKTFTFEQIQTLLWLGESVESFKNRVNNWTKVSSYTKAYETTGGYPVLIQEAQPALCRRLLCLPLSLIHI